ncbi:MAG: hypothetical protein ACYCSQ_00215 [bacterium]
MKESVKIQAELDAIGISLTNIGRLSDNIKKRVDIKNQSAGTVFMFTVSAAAINRKLEEAYTALKEIKKTAESLENFKAIEYKEKKL